MGTAFGEGPKPPGNWARATFAGMEMKVADNSKEARERAETRFKKAQKAAQEGDRARAAYEAQAQATREKTARLKKLRLEKEAAEEKEKGAKAPAARRKKRSP